jgi:superfamily II DNA or RNA helicase
MQTTLLPQTAPQFQLRDYQKRMIAEIYQSIRAGNKSIACIASTGSGKTILSSQIITDAISKGRKALFLVTIDCLILQTLDKLQHLPRVGVIAGKHPKTNYEDADIFVASLQTLARRSEWLDRHWDLAIWDEAHTSKWFGCAEHIKASWHLGFTATPYRLSKKQSFGEKFDDVVIAPSMAELIEHGSLVPLKYFGIKDKLDLSGISTRNGDFAEDELALVVNSGNVINNALDAREQIAPGKRTIAFAVNVAHARAIAEVANARGIKTEVVTGETTDRTSIFARLVSREIEMISSCQALSTGFDCVQAEVALLMRPTKSTALHEQQIGRVARPSPGTGKEHGIVIDTACNVARHGQPCGKVHSKETVLTPSSKRNGDAPVKECPKCFALLHLSIMKCPECGHEFEVKEKQSIEAVGEYVELYVPKFDEIVGLDGAIYKTSEPGEWLFDLRNFVDVATKRGWKKIAIAHKFANLYPELTHEQERLLTKVLGYKHGWFKHFIKMREDGDVA